MATIADIQQWFANNPNATDQQIAAAANASGVSADQIAAATGVPLSQVASRLQTATPAAGTSLSNITSSLPAGNTSTSAIKAAPPTWNDVYNQWFANEYVPWINSVQGTNVKESDLTKNDAGAYVPNAAIPLWNWNTGADTAAQKQELDQRYLQALDTYNQQNGTNIQPDQSVLGVNVQPNASYRAADKSSGILGTGIGPDISFSDAAKLAALYYGGSAAIDALGAGTAGADAAAAGEAAGSTGTGLSVGAGNTGLGLTMPEATTGLGLTAPSGVGGLAAGSAAGTDLATAAGIGAGIGTLSPYAAGTGSALAGTSLADLGAGTAVGAGLGSALGAGTGSAVGSSLGTALTVGAVANGLTGLANANAAKDAANQQTAAANAATQAQLDMFNKINAQQAPYRAAGYGALNQLGSMGSGQYQAYDANGNPIGTGTGSGYLTHQFNAADLTAGLAPNYDFMLQQGQMANQRAANVAGGGLGGNALQGLQKYTQDYAGNAYQNAFNNYQTQRSNIYNTLAGIAGIGQTGQNATNTAATNAVNATTQLGVGSAAAQAAGTVGATNAYSNAVNNAVNNYTLASLLKQGGSVA